MKPSDAVDLVAKLASAYPSAKIERQTAQTYAEMLQDLDLDEAQRAIVACICECKFMPTVAEIRERVVCGRVDALDPDLAWSEVLLAVRKYGIYQTPKFDNPCVEIAVSNVGWRQICNSTKLGIERSAFVRAYQAALVLAKREQNADRLLRHVDQKRIAGLHDAKPALTRGNCDVSSLVADLGWDKEPVDA